MSSKAFSHSCTYLGSSSHRRWSSCSRQSKCMSMMPGWPSRQCRSCMCRTDSRTRFLHNMRPKFTYTLYYACVLGCTYLRSPSSHSYCATVRQSACKCEHCLKHTSALKHNVQAGSRCAVQQIVWRLGRAAGVQIPVNVIAGHISVLRQRHHHGRACTLYNVVSAVRSAKVPLPTDAITMSYRYLHSKQHQTASASATPLPCTRRRTVLSVC